MKRMLSMLFLFVAVTTISRAYGEELTSPPDEDGELVVEKVQSNTFTLHCMYWVKMGASIFGQKKVFNVKHAKFLGYESIQDIHEGDYVRVVYEKPGEAYVAKSVSKAAPSAHRLAESQRAALPDTQAVPQADDLKRISDSTLLKVLLLDYSENILGLGWQDRDRQGIGSTTIMGSITNLTARYSIADPTKQKILTDMPVSLRRGGASDEKGDRIYVSFDGGWHELLRFSNYGKLPPVKYYDAHLSVNLKSMTVTFGKKTRIMVEGRQYISVDGKLVPAKATPRKPTSRGKK